MKTTTALAALALSASLTSAQEVNYEYEVETADLLTQTEDSLGMSVSWQVGEGEYRVFGRSITAWGVFMTSSLTGTFRNNEYYQTWYQFPSIDTPGVYEGFTCTVQYKSSGDHNFMGISNYQGEVSLMLPEEDAPSLASQRETISGGPKQQEYLDVEDWNFAGWREEFDLDGLEMPAQINTPDTLSCGAARVFLAHGSLSSTIASYYPDEVTWIYKHDWDEDYDVQSGYKRWQNMYDDRPDGMNAPEFGMEITCAKCEVALAGAATLVASALAMVTILAY